MNSPISAYAYLSDEQFAQVLKVAWDNKTNDLSLRKELDAILKNPWITLSRPQIEQIVPYIKAIDYWLATKPAPRQAPPLHCVRCHASFVEGEVNTPCVLYHAVDTTRAISAPNNQTAPHYISKCCGYLSMATFTKTEEFTGYVSHSGDQYCFNPGAHTTDPSVVEVGRRNITLPWLTGLNVVPCDMVMGICVRKVLTKGAPGTIHPRL